MGWNSNGDERETLLETLLETLMVTADPEILFGPV
jgi:hypothetical protein